jgi:hypothetical protein
MMPAMTDGPQQPQDPHHGFPGNNPFPPYQPQEQPPAWNTPGQPAPRPAEPDWGALAEESESRARRRKLLLISGGVLAVAAIAGIVATAVVSSDHSGGGTNPTAGPSADVSEQPLPPQPTFSDVSIPPPPNPLDFISDAKKDTAPLTSATLFPGRSLLWQSRTYTKTAATGATSCTSAAASALAIALADNGCRQVFRATYVRDTIAVTVGIAVFDNSASAAKLKNTAQYIRPLNGGGVTDFCHAVACRFTSNAVGRYAYFTTAGLKNNQTISTTDTAADAAAMQAGADISDFAFNQIRQRGVAQASAAAASPAG